MSTNHNELPEVNQYIKDNNLTPCDEEVSYGHSYNPIHDITYLVINNDNAYMSFDEYRLAKLLSLKHNNLLIVCRGKIHE